VTCDFEVDECNWKFDSIWRIYPSGSTPDTASSGPTADHTNGSKLYLKYLSSLIYFIQDGNYARFMGTRLSESIRFGVMNTSTAVQETTPFSFWYFMHGTQIGTLTVVVNDQSIWQKSGRQGFPAWYQANISLPVGADVKVSILF
jgi:hypothetical protein